MTCPACHGEAHTGYDRRGRPVPCRKCRATGVIGGPREAGAPPVGQPAGDVEYAAPIP